MGTDTPATGGFGEHLLRLRTDAGQTQEELAHAAGVSVRALSDMERGRSRGPQRRTVAALAAALGLNATGTEALERDAGRGRRRARGAAGEAAAGSYAGTGPPADAGGKPAIGPPGCAGPAGAAAPGPSVRHTLALPRDLRDFTARGPALARLAALAEQPGPDRPQVAVVCGQPGLGKTAFAVHAAHTLVPLFPDGQFYLDLRGMDQQPTPPRDALARLLRALGATDVPAGTDDRSGLLRSLLRDRRVLLLLDNAADENQVRPLLPGEGASLTLVTSRHALAGLEAVHRTELALLRREEAVELLTRIIGPHRVTQEAQAARDLAELCGHLPLAVRIAGQRLAARSTEHIGKLATQLAEQGGRLDALKAGSLEVRAAFALSYRQLSPQARTVFRRSCLAGGPDFSPQTAALLADLPARTAARHAEDLVDAGLLQSHPTADRYRYHDLLRLFAAEQLAEEDGTEEIAASEDRAARWTLRRATAAALHFEAEYGSAAAQGDAEGDPDPATAPVGSDRARAWLEEERAQWLGALRHAQSTGRHREVIDAAEAMHWFSDATMDWELWAEVFLRAADSARALGSTREVAVQLNYLAWARNMCVFDYAGALAAADAALEAALEAGDELQVGWALGYGAGALQRLGRIGEAVARLRASVARFAGLSCGDSRLAELTALNALGQVLRMDGRPEEALAIHRRSEALCRAGIPGRPTVVSRAYLALVSQCIGNDLAALGRWSEAEAPLREVLSLRAVNPASFWSETARLELGVVLRHLGRHDEARQSLTAAHEALVRLNHPRQLEAAAELSTLEAADAASRARARGRAADRPGGPH
ncbi:tetratricopeptide repeat protein [Streptomyces sp. NPDC005409]|uniref:tetratricopeptide repeat protein n=1 Tax=Streptomyces sp. NPDC005409 TaxID=3155342 RepID=UPI003452EA0B